MIYCTSALVVSPVRTFRHSYDKLHVCSMSTEQSEAHIIDGKAIAASIRTELTETVAGFKKSTGVTPGLAVVLVGEWSLQVCWY